MRWFAKKKKSLRGGIPTGTSCDAPVGNGATSVGNSGTPIEQRSGPVECAFTDWQPSRAHAQLLLTWLQGQNGRVGWIYHDEIYAMYRDMALEHGLKEHGWLAIARELRRLLRQSKTTAGPDRKRIYYIPAAPDPPSLSIVSRIRDS